MQYNVRIALVNDLLRRTFVTLKGPYREIVYKCLIVLTPYQNIKHLTGVGIEKIRIIVLLRVDDGYEPYFFLRSWIEINVYKY